MRVELYAEPCGKSSQIFTMERGAPVTGSFNSYVYSAFASAELSAEAYTIRVVPAYAGARVPTELDPILWQK